MEPSKKTKCVWGYFFKIIFVNAPRPPPISSIYGSGFEKENLRLLKLADDNYEKSISLGGIDDKIIVDAKARFDNFYELLNKTKKQDKANQALRDDRNSMAGSSDSEYE